VLLVLLRLDPRPTARKLVGAWKKKGLRGIWLEIPNDLLKQLEGTPELLAAIFRERGEGFG
jgi:hypothetical protein